MPLRARSVFLGIVIIVASSCYSTRAQAPAQTKKPPTPPVTGTAPASPQSKHFPILLLASGNNPAWSVRIGQKGPERLDRPGYPPIALEPAEVTHDPSGDAWIYHAKDTQSGVSVSVRVSREACSDGMSATKYTFRAAVEDPQLGAWNGCARIAAEHTMFTVAVGAAVQALLVALASLLITPIYLAKFSSGEVLGQAAFIAAIVGGFNQVRGAIAGGLLIGVVLIVGALTFFPALALGPILEQLQLAAGHLH